jgi:predicted MFS family arabinose efflux permease
MQPDDHGSKSASAPMPLTALSLPGIRLLLFVCALFMAAFYGIYGFLGDYLHNGLGLAISVNGLTALAYGVGFGGAVFLDRCIHRVSLRWSLPISLLTVSGIYLLIAVIGTNLYTMLMLLVFLGLMNHFTINMLIVRLTAIESTKRGAIMGLYSAVTNLAVFAGTLGFAPLYAATGFAVSAYAATALTLIAAIASAIR